MTTAFAYPECRSASDGPCEAATSVEEACSSRFGGESLWHQRWCQCTDGYYSRSSQCWIDCYGQGRTTTDFASISRANRLVELDCESYSINIEADEAFTSVQQQRSSDAEASASLALNSSLAAAATSSLGASQGATVPILTPEATSWVDRPTATGGAQSNAGSAIAPAGGSGVLILMTAVLVLSKFFR